MHAPGAVHSGSLNCKRWIKVWRCSDEGDDDGGGVHYRLLQQVYQRMGLTYIDWRWRGDKVFFVWKESELSSH